MGMTTEQKAGTVVDTVAWLTWRQRLAVLWALRPSNRAEVIEDFDMIWHDDTRTNTTKYTYRKISLRTGR